MITIKIDGRKVKTKEGTTVLQAAQELRIEIPTLCSYKDLSPFGACRLCVVEVKANGKWQLATSCDAPVKEGMEVRTKTDRVKEGRRLAAELLYYRYPTTGAVRDIARKLGVDVAEGKAEDHDCILCGLCTRTCHEVVGVDALTFMDRGPGRKIDQPKIEYIADACIGCGSCAFVCPTGFVKMEEKGNQRTIWDKNFKMESCGVCGRYFAPVDQLQWISKKTGVPYEKLKTCTSCR